MTKTALIIAGVTGQDGACLAELLLGKRYEVHGDEIPDLSAQTHLAVSFETPEYMSFDALVRKVVVADYRIAKRDSLLQLAAFGAHESRE